MSITVTGRKTSVTPALKDYIDEKIGGALEVFQNAIVATDVVLRVEKNPAIPQNSICEVTVSMKGTVVRVSEAAEDMYAAIDIASDKVARQMRKYKTRIVDKKGKREKAADIAPDIDAFFPPEEEDDLLVRIKELELEPMTEEHALVQTDLLGHDFFVYYDIDTEQVQVIYHRSNGGYGIIKPVVKKQQLLRHKKALTATDVDGESKTEL